MFTPRRYLGCAAFAALLACAAFIVGCGSSSPAPAGGVCGNPLGAVEPLCRTEEENQIAVIERLKPVGSARSLPKVQGGFEALSDSLRYLDFPAMANIKGTVVVRFTIDKAGRTHELEVIETPHESLNEQVLQLLSATTFDSSAIRNPVEAEAAARFDLIPCQRSDKQGV
jgi:TonB family protein